MSKSIQPPSGGKHTSPKAGTGPGRGGKATTSPRDNRPGSSTGGSAGTDPGSGGFLGWLFGPSK